MLLEDAPPTPPDAVASFGSRGSASWVCLVGLSVFSPCLPIGILVDKDHLWIVGKDFYLLISLINQLLMRPSYYQPTVGRGGSVDDS